MPVVLLRRIVGLSMAPTLSEGRLVLGLTGVKKVKVGQVYVYTQDGREVIKRLTQVRGEEMFFVGDNRALSSDSRTFGWVGPDRLIARVIWPPAKRPSGFDVSESESAKSDQNNQGNR
jgi:phage repressor protein C with HTH and peptisase S24 domain